MIMTWNPRDYLESLFEKCIERTITGNPWNHREVAISGFLPFLFWIIPAYYCLWIYELSCLLARETAQYQKKMNNLSNLQSRLNFEAAKGGNENYW